MIFLNKFAKNYVLTVILEEHFAIVFYIKKSYNIFHIFSASVPVFQAYNAMIHKISFLKKKSDRRLNKFGTS